MDRDRRGNIRDRRGPVGDGPGSDRRERCFFCPSGNSTLRRYRNSAGHGTLAMEVRNMNQYVTGEAIRALREKIGYTQAELAEKLMVSDKAVSKWETGVSHN